METITAAKKALEKKIISNAFVTGIGVRTDGKEQYIHVGIESEKHKPEIEALLTEGKWYGYPVKVSVQPLSEPH